MADVVSTPSFAQAYSYQPEQALSYDDYVRQVHANDGYGTAGQELASWIYSDNIFGNIANFFGGHKDRMEKDYKTYLDALNKRNEERALANARAYDEWFESTKYQRAVDDLKKAGLNPWLAVNSGFANQSPATTTNSSAKGVQYEMLEKKGALSGLLGALAKLIG